MLTYFSKILGCYFISVEEIGQKACVHPNWMSHHFWSEAYFKLVQKIIFRPIPELLSCHTRCSTSLKQVISGLLTCPFSPGTLSDHSVSAIRTSHLTFKERQKEKYFIALSNKVNQSDNMKQLVIFFLKERSNFIKLSEKYVGYKHHHHFCSIYIIFFPYYKWLFPGGMCVWVSAHQVLKWQMLNYWEIKPWQNNTTAWKCYNGLSWKSSVWNK